MKDIDVLYKNEFGVGFYWNSVAAKKQPQVQLVFRDMGFYLTTTEVKQFEKLVSTAKENGSCRNCGEPNCCKSILVKTPCHQIDLAMHSEEINALQDLIRGTLFHISLRHYITHLSLN